MSPKPTMWLVDTSILLNMLDIPGRNQDRQNVISDFEDRIKTGAILLLPFTSIIECGNQIAKLPMSNERQYYAQKFSELVKQSIKNESPWQSLAFPSQDDILQWLADFPKKAQQGRSKGRSMGDHMIIKQWKEHCDLFPAYIVKIWSLDGDLQGFECNR